MRACVRACACGRACVRACVRAYVRVCVDVCVSVRVRCACSCVSFQCIRCCEQSMACIITIVIYAYAYYFHKVGVTRHVFSNSIAVSSHWDCLERFRLHLPVHSNAISTYLRSVQPHCNYCAKTIRSHMHHCLSSDTHLCNGVFSGNVT